MGISKLRNPIRSKLRMIYLHASEIFFHSISLMSIWLAVDFGLFVTVTAQKPGDLQDEAINAVKRY